MTDSHPRCCLVTMNPPPHSVQATHPSCVCLWRVVVEQVTEHVERAEALLGVRHDTFVDEKAATAAVSTARGEIAIARLSIRKARAAVDRAEEEER